MSVTTRFLLFFLIIFPGLALARDSQTFSDSIAKQAVVAADSSHPKPSPPIATAQESPRFALQWIEEHPVLFSLIAAGLGLLGGWLLARRGEKKAPEVTRKTKRVEKEVEREFVKEIQIEAEDEIERRYLQGVHNEHDTIRLFGFQSSANLQVRTLEVFVSLNLTEESRVSGMREISEVENGFHLSPEKVLQAARRKNRLLLITGDPGSGKTTLLKYYAMCCLDAAGRRNLGLQKPLLPILLPLRKVDPAKPFCEALSAWATQSNRPVTPKQFDDWLHRRGALVMLDGLDEIGDLKKRKRVCEWIDEAANYFDHSQFVVTSRHTGYGHVGYGKREIIELHTNHLRASVLDLDDAQQAVFLRKWFAAVYGEKLEAADLSAGAQKRELHEQADQVAAAIRKFLALEENENLRKMAGAPVLLQIMAILWKEYHNLPPKRADLYEKCIDYLLDYRDRDREKDLAPPLPANDAKSVLRPLCWWLQQERKTELTLTELEEKVKDRLQAIDPKVSARDFAGHLVERAGLLHKFGNEAAVFRHRSFCEYLAGCELAERIHREPALAQTLVDNFNDDWWRETVLFSLSLPTPVIFDDFFRCFLPHAHNAAGFPPLLEQVLKEARQKPVAAFESFLGNAQVNWQQGYNALLCLRLIASEAAQALVKKVWEREKHHKIEKNEGRQRLLQKAEEILIEWKLHRPAVAAAAGPGLERSWRNPFELEAEYIRIPGGKYRFSVTKQEVTVPELYFAKYPVTNKLYRRFIAYLREEKSMAEVLQFLPLQLFAESLLVNAKGIEGFIKHIGKNPEQWAQKLVSSYDDDKRFNGDDQPVVGLTWFAATAYCSWLSELQKANSKGQKEIITYRLPVEEEWEWAASGGKREYPWGNDEPDETRANYANKVGQTTAVGAYPAGATSEGLHDMAGNVWEWMENPYGAGAIFGKEARALRGGAWNYYAVDLRCVARLNWDPDYRYNSFGFRVVLSQSSF
ncbi:signal transduction protein [candidate division KSB1 bacterium]|nr:MAG: signal transduction protein [candidate division KSB1 bacterium]